MSSSRHQHRYISMGSSGISSCWGPVGRTKKPTARYNASMGKISCGNEHFPRRAGISLDNTAWMERQSTLRNRALGGKSLLA